MTGTICKRLTLSTILIGLLTGCGGLSGGSQFGGEDANQNSRDEGAPAAAQLGDGLVLDGAEADRSLAAGERKALEDGQTPSQSSIMECRDRSSTTVVDFEDYAELETATALAKSMRRHYGLSFENRGQTHLAVAVATGPRDQRPEFVAWKSVKCPRKPNANQICRGGDVGKRVLSSLTALNAREMAFAINFEEAVRWVSFDMIDLDGSEKWTVRAIDRRGRSVAEMVIDARAGYRKPSGNSEAQTFTLSASKKFERVEFSGRKNGKAFGFAIDNIAYRHTPCRK